jgi:hypothetical protein
MLGKKPYLSPTIAKGHKILTQEAHALWRAVWRRDFFSQQRRNPVASHQFAHGCSGAYSGDEIVFLERKHEFFFRPWRDDRVALCNNQAVN